MSDTTPPPFDPTSLDAQPADLPDAQPKPDHTASADPVDSVEDFTPDNVRPFLRGKTKRDKKAKREKPERDVPPKRKGQLVRPLTDLYVSVGATVSAFDPVCGMTILDNAEKCAESLDAVAQRNEAVRRALFAMLETSAWGGVMAAHMPILVLLAVHHGPRDVQARFAPIAMFVAPNSFNAMMDNARAQWQHEQKPAAGDA